MSGGLKSVLDAAGEQALNSMHDPAMPNCLHEFIDHAFVSMWPEVEKGVLDKHLLGAGFQFAAFRKQHLEHRARRPSGPTRTCGCRAAAAASCSGPTRARAAAQM